MTCEDVLDAIEPLACGDREPDAETRTHLETCPRCAAALASARRLEALLLAVDVPAAAEGFTAAVVQRIRRDRWQSEQHVDRLFNAAIAIAVLLVSGAVLAMLNLGTVLSTTATAWALLREGTREVVQDAAPTLTTYVGGIGLLATALLTWWWADRRLEF